MRYTPNPIPDALARAELERVAHVLASPNVDRLEFKTWQSVPGKPEEGHVYLFADGVLGTGGLYLYFEGAWNRITSTLLP